MKKPLACCRRTVFPSNERFRSSANGALVVMRIQSDGGIQVMGLRQLCGPLRALRQRISLSRADSFCAKLAKDCKARKEAHQPRGLKGNELDLRSFCSSSERLCSGGSKEGRPYSS